MISVRTLLNQQEARITPPEAQLLHILTSANYIIHPHSYLNQRHKAYFNIIWGTDKVAW